MDTLSNPIFPPCSYIFFLFAFLFSLVFFIMKKKQKKMKKKMEENRDIFLAVVFITKHH